MSFASLSSGVVLASASPRRRELLAKILGTSPFEIVPADLDETIFDHEAPEAAAERLAAEKARTVSIRFLDALVIAADTIVFVRESDGSRMFSKPADAEDAVQTLLSLSNRTHHVVTGVALVHGDWEASFVEVSHVTFRALSRQEVEAYVATGEPMDKAGSYGIQGCAAKFVVRVEGSLDNVIGLPTERLFAELQKHLGVL